MDTSTLYSRSDEAKAKVEAIDKAYNAALYQIELIAHGLQDQFKVSDAEERRFLDAASEYLQDMLADVREAAVEEQTSADREIGNIEERDMQLSGSVW